MKLLKPVFIIFIAIGTIMFTFFVVFKVEPTYLTKIYYGNLVAYKLDTYSYIKNLESSITSTAELNLHLPNDIWQLPTGTIVEEQFWQAVLNNMQFIFNYFLLVANLFVWPLRLIAYILRQAMVIIGMNVQEGATTNGFLQWLVDLARNLQMLEIPYVNQ